jgi:hypothetical protein
VRVGLRPAAGFLFPQRLIALRAASRISAHLSAPPAIETGNGLEKFIAVFFPEKYSYDADEDHQTRHPSGNDQHIPHPASSALAINRT